MTEDDLTRIADVTRESLKKKVKITQYPWQERSELDMDELYMDVTLEKLYRKACRLHSKVLENYHELFNPDMRNKGERILLKGDPGMGKTTLVKKITHDWVRERFTDVSIVFFVMLKLVKPGEAIENVIIKQTPTLRGNNVQPDKMRRILQRFGPKCLLVLDGFDEQGQGRNQDVISIIEGGKYPDCKVIVTSRPHSTKKIESEFDTIGRVEGFAEDQARKFVERIVHDPSVVDQILKFNPRRGMPDSEDEGGDDEGEGGEDAEGEGGDDEGGVAEGEGGDDEGEGDDDDEGEGDDNEGEGGGDTEGKGENSEGKGGDGDEEEERMPAPLYRIPILLSIMCFLVRHDKSVSDLFSKSEQKGFIYFRMVRCLFSTFVEKKVEYEDSDFIDVVTSVGKLAWQTLLSGNLMFRKKEVVREVGSEAFEWGLLIGDEDPEGLSDETADILVTFAHRSIQQFFGAFYFILRLSKGESVNSLVGGRSDVEIDDPLFLEFCLWFLDTSEKTFSFLQNRVEARDALVDHVVKEADEENFGVKFNAFNVTEMSPLLVDFVKDVLSRCLKIERLGFIRHHPVGQLLSGMRSSSIKILKVGETFDDVQSFIDPRNYCLEAAELLVIIKSMLEPAEVLRHVMEYCERAVRRPCVFVTLQKNHELELSSMIKNGLYGLHLDCLCGRVVCKRDIPDCQSLRHLSMDNLKNGDNVLRALRKAFQSGRLPNVNYLGFDGCSFKTKGILPYLFPSGSPTPGLQHLDLAYVTLNESDIHFIAELRTTLTWLAFSAEAAEFLFEKRWDTLTSITITEMDLRACKTLACAVNENKLPNLVELALLDKDGGDESLLELKAEMLPHVRRLRLEGFMYSPEMREDLAEKLATWHLEYLEIGESIGIEGNLSVLLRYGLRSLETLELSECKLNLDDMRCLTEAGERGKLPKLKRLDLPRNLKGARKMLIRNEADWGTWRDVKVINY